MILKPPLHRPVQRGFTRLAILQWCLRCHSLNRPSHPFAGEDAPVCPLEICGLLLESHNLSKTLVGADDSVRPPKCYDFALDFRENGRFPRADRVVRPYDEKR